MAEVLEFQLPSFPNALPVIPVTLMGQSGVKRTIDVILDTGSTFCLITTGLARTLGLSIAGPPNGKLIGINGQQSDYWRSQVTIRLSNGRSAFQWDVDVAFTDGYANRPTVGCRGFFEHFSTTFDGENRYVRIVTNSNFPGIIQSTNSSLGS